jgi:hypothetical protein
MGVISSTGAGIVLTIIPPREIAGQEPSALGASAMKSVNIILSISGKARCVISVLAAGLLQLEADSRPCFKFLWMS